MVKSGLITRLKKGKSLNNIILSTSEEAKICLTCDLPAKACNKSSCQRYNEMKNKLKENILNG